mgnify:CR=1 FL=1
MSIYFKCPSCGTALEAPQYLAGKAGKCPYCEGAVTVPAESQLYVKQDATKI